MQLLAKITGVSNLIKFKNDCSAADDSRIDGRVERKNSPQFEVIQCVQQSSSYTCSGTCGDPVKRPVQCQPGGVLRECGCDSDR